MFVRTPKDKITPNCFMTELIIQKYLQKLKYLLNLKIVVYIFLLRLYNYFPLKFNFKNPNEYVINNLCFEYRDNL